MCLMTARNLLPPIGLAAESPAGADAHKQVSPWSASWMAGGFVVNAAVKQVHVAEEVVDERRRRVIVDLVRTADLLDAAVVHHHHAVGDLERLFLIVGDEHAGDVDLVVQLAQPAAQLLAGPSRRARRTARRAAAPWARPPARAPARRAGAGRRRAGPDNGPARFFSWTSSSSSWTLAWICSFDGRTLRGPDFQAEGDVLEHGHVPEERVVLEDEADAAIAGGAVGRVLAVEKNGAGIGEFQPGDDAQQRRLAGAGRAEQRHQLARGNRQIDLVERGELPELLGDVFRLRCSCRFALLSSQRQTPRRLAPRSSIRPAS